mgnify:CR=1 FL=1
MSRIQSHPLIENQYLKKILISDFWEQYLTLIIISVFSSQ